jgi:glucose-1-phosphate thymidylyltransferase
MRLDYAEQPAPEGLAQAFIIGADFVGDSPSALILGDNLFYGHDLISSLDRASDRTTGATIFGYHVADPKSYGVVEFGPDGRVRSLEEKPAHPKSNFAIPGIYFYDKDVVAHARALKPSKRGELEITDLNRIYLEAGRLHVEILGRGTAWLDTGTCLEEIAWRKGWIDKAQLQAAIAKLGKSAYADYLRQLPSDHP